MKTPFRPATFDFLRELARNNDREWFNANKPRYEADAKGPALAFVREFGVSLARIAPRFVADPRPVGGSLFRIYRDTRFSKDKTPYKTHLGIHFRHEEAGDVHAPGFYLHLEPGEVFAAAGLWHPEPDVAHRIRQAIVDRPRDWRAAVGGAAFRRLCRLDGERLKRPPRGFDPAHPLVEVLQFKDFTCMTPLSEKQACAGDFPRRVAAAFSAAAPFMAFLTRAVGLRF